MSYKTLTKQTFKKIMKQISGDISPEDGELFPEAVILGKGDIWCFDPTTRSMRRVPRGIKVYLLTFKPDELNRYVAYTPNGNIIMVEEEELLITECD